MNAKRIFKKPFLSWLIVIVAAIALAFVIRTFMFSPVIVDGKSMYPTYHDRDHLFMQKITQPKRGNKIVFNASHIALEHKGNYFIKRIIGIPGDKIEFRNGDLYLNGKRKREKYLLPGTKTYRFPQNGGGNFTLKDITGKAVVPKGKWFVLGDNRNESSDSRVFGFVEKKDLEGVIIDF